MRPTSSLATMESDVSRQLIDPIAKLLLGGKFALVARWLRAGERMLAFALRSLCGEVSYGHLAEANDWLRLRHHRFHMPRAMEFCCLDAALRAAKLLLSSPHHRRPAYYFPSPLSSQRRQWKRSISTFHVVWLSQRRRLHRDIPSMRCQIKFLQPAVCALWLKQSRPLGDDVHFVPLCGYRPEID
jgi:hypothetical protein